jgi:membrane protease YdiL (CAAX protease family)
MVTTPTLAVESVSTLGQPLDRQKRLRWFEVSLVMLVAFGSALLNSVDILEHGPRLTRQMSGFGTLEFVVHEAAALLLVGYVLSRGGRRLRHLGLRWSLKDVGLGVLVAVIALLVYGLGTYAIRELHLVIYGIRAISNSPRSLFGHPSLVGATASVLVNPFFEELIVRAYLMTEVLELTGSATLAVVLSVGIQAAYHLYYGWSGAVAIGFQFLTFALYYARWRRALPVIVAHGLSDLLGVMRLL